MTFAESLHTQANRDPPGTWPSAAYGMYVAKRLTE